MKSRLAYPWNRYLRRWLKRGYYSMAGMRGKTTAQKAAKAYKPEPGFKEGDRIRVRSKAEIKRTLDPFNELKGCAFLPQMNKYCGTEQHIFRVMKHFIDERDYRLKKTSGIVLLENVFCNGTAIANQCDRSCFLFWRQEWLEKTDPA